MEEIELISSALEKYIDTYYEKVSVDNAQNAFDDFDEQWSAITEYMIDETENRQSKYGQALVTLSVAVYELSDTTKDEVTRLSNLINAFENNTNVKYKFGIKEALYFNLGYCWHKVSSLYDNKAIEAFKKYVYYLVTLSSHTSYRPTAYAFRKCNKYLYKSLRKEQLNISSPTTFNDPFDCPIIELLSHGDDIASLIHRAYKDCLKIACFSSNIKLPYLENPNDMFSKKIIDEKKHKNDKEEFLNELMWAHYSDSHKGVCIKYSFCDSISNLGNNNDKIVSYFKDVKYSTKDLSGYSKKDAITLEDSFFLKGKQWEYENELRYLYFDLDCHSKFGTVDIPNSIEAIYFGLKCSARDKKKILRIMKSKKHVKKDLKGSIISQKPVEFYQMEMDYEHFGQIKATKLNT